MNKDIKFVVSAHDTAAPVFRQLETAISGVASTALGLERSVSGLGPLIAGVGAQLAAFAAAGLSVGTTLARFNAAVQDLDALNDLADATGASVENLSALEDIARRTGASLDTVGAVLVRFNKVLLDAKPGSDAAKALQAIGLSAQELRNQDPAEALRTAAQALAEFADDGDKARLIQELFGKSVREAAPFLNDLAKSSGLVATTTTKAAQEAEKFAQQMSALRKNVDDVERSVASRLLPTLNNAIEAMKKFSLGDFMRELGLEMKSNMAADELRTTVAQIENIQKALDRDKAAGRPEDMYLVKRLRSLREEADELSRKGAKYSETLKGIANSLDPSSMESKFGFKGRPGDEKRRVGNLEDAAAVKKTSELERYLQRLQEAQLGVLDLSAVEQAQIDIALGKLGQLTAAQEAQVLSLAKGLDLLRNKAGDMVGPVQAPEDVKRWAELFRLIEDTPTAQLAKLVDLTADLDLAFSRGLVGAKEYADAVAALDERFTNLNRSAASAAAAADEARSFADVMSLIDQTPSAQLEKIARLSGDLERAFAAGKVGAQEYVQALDLLDQRYRDVSQAAADAARGMTQSAMEAQRNIQATLGDTLADALGGNFESIEQRWAQMLQRMLADALAVDLTNAAFGQSKQGGIGDLFSGLGNLFGGGRAYGGPVSAGRLYEVNERGRPEMLSVGGRDYLMMGSQPGQVSPAGGASPGASGLVQNFYFSHGVKPEEMRAAMLEARRSAVAQAKGEIRQSMRRGGAYAQ